MTLEQFSQQVKRGYYPPSPAHQMLYFDHPLGRIMRLIYSLGVESEDLLIAEMWCEYCGLEAIRKKGDSDGNVSLVHGASGEPGSVPDL